MTASRTTAAGNPVNCYVASMVGKTGANVQATATVALVKQSDYEWVGLDSISLDGGNALFGVNSYDSSNPSAATGDTTLRTNGSVTMTGPVRVDGDVKYGTTKNVAPASKISGTISQSSQTLSYPPGSQVANLQGVTPVYSATSDLTVTSNMTLGGGTYIIKNCNLSNCTITFTGPVTIVLTGNLNMTNCGFATSGNLPKNLKIISTGTDTAINIDGLTSALTADIYAPGSTFNMNTPNGSYGMNGRGVFKTMTVSGKGANSPLQYDRSLTASSLSAKAILVR